MSQQLLTSNDRGVYQDGEEARAAFAALASHLVGMDGISVLVCVDHGQRDRHGVTHKRDGHCVSRDVRERAQGGEFGLRESGNERVQDQTAGRC